MKTRKTLLFALFCIGILLLAMGTDAGGKKDKKSKGSSKKSAKAVKSNETKKKSSKEKTAVSSMKFDKSNAVKCFMNTRKECKTKTNTAGKPVESCSNVEETCKGSCCLTEMRSGSKNKINQYCYDGYACAIVSAAMQHTDNKLENCFSWDNYKRCVCTKDECNKPDALQAYAIYADGVATNSVHSRPSMAMAMNSFVILMATTGLLVQSSLSW